MIDPLPITLTPHAVGFMWADWNGNRLWHVKGLVFAPGTASIPSCYNNSTFRLCRIGSGVYGDAVVAHRERW